MRIRKPRVVVEFYDDQEPRVLYLVRPCIGAKIICNDAAGAVELLGDECISYLGYLSQIEGE